jgi:rare lipoprotein A
MKSTAKIRTVSSALVLLACSGWSVSHAAPASEGAAADQTVDGGAAPDRDVGSVRRVQRLSPEAKPTLDRSGRTRVGKASFYAKMFSGRTMADGTRMEPTGNNAASRTLPLGTTATVTNLETGKTAVVTIRDRGPYVAGRIVDLSPATAQAIGLDKRTGVTKVKVAPIAVPLADGEIKLGDGVLQASNLEGSDSLGTGGHIEMRTRTP